MKRRGLPLPAPEELLDLPLHPGGDEPAFLRGKTRAARARRARRGWMARAILVLQVSGAAFVAVAAVWGTALLGGLMPQEGVSWQGHFFGAVGGVLAAWLLARRPAPAA